MAGKSLIHTSIARTHGNIQRFEQNSDELREHLYKFALIPWSDGFRSVCEVTRDPFLHPDYCQCDRTVFDISTMQTGSDGLPMKIPPHQPISSVEISKIKVLDQQIKTVANAKVSVIFDSAESASSWRADLPAFENILLSVLSMNLFYVTQHSLVDVEGLDLHNIKYLVFHCNKLNGCLAKFSKNSKISVRNVIDIGSYSKVLSTKNYQVALGLEAPFEKLNNLVRDCLRNGDEDRKNNKVLVSGPSGCGKTVLVEHLCQRNNLSLIQISGGTFAESKPGEAEQKLRSIFETAKRLTHCAIVIDQIEAVCPKINDTTQSHSRRLVKQMASLLDEYLHSVFVVGVTSKPGNVDPSIIRAGRLEHEISIGPPTEKEREIMLKNLLSNFIKDSNSVESFSSEAAKVTPGYVLADLSMLARETALLKTKLPHNDWHSIFKCALAGMKPASLRSGLGVVTTDPMSIQQIGGLTEIKKKLKILIEWPLVHPEAFERMGIPRPKGVLLYGPPGCAKTSLVKSIATMTGKSFFAVSAAELYSSLVGESEKSVVALFRKARSAAPAILFIDEIDALVGHRGGGQIQTGVQERVLATVLVEMDGLIAPSSEGGVLIVASTNRPDLVDAALLRPGRFDQIIHVPAPDFESRKSILVAKSSCMAVSPDVDWNAIARKTELFSGADLQNLCQEAALHALTIDGMEVEEVQYKHFEFVLQNMKPSLSSKCLDWFTKYKPGH
ncbi:ATPase family gene 2 protein homolog B-like [Neocloeon triangulifer]|uniref:ATPase family gene 2 protein homolog B-like n=1 Tax=Neocloeon triangulifer TaxID=2078957 RepID=UPI00286EB850|nr:ATPase family gene 2 protein homolog B-like [Neocloeon triangulifer]